MRRKRRGEEKKERERVEEGEREQEEDEEEETPKRTGENGKGREKGDPKKGEDYKEEKKDKGKDSKKRRNEGRREWEGKPSDELIEREGVFALIPSPQRFRYSPKGGFSPCYHGCERISTNVVHLFHRHFCGIYHGHVRSAVVRHQRNTSA